MFHLSLPVGAVAEIKAVAAETPGEDIEEEPHGDGEKAVDKGEGKILKVTPEDKTYEVKTEENIEEEQENEENAVGKGEEKKPKITNLKGGQTIHVKPDDRTIIVKPEDEEDQENAPENAPKIKVTPGRH